MLSSDRGFFGLYFRGRPTFIVEETCLRHDVIDFSSPDSSRYTLQAACVHVGHNLRETAIWQVRLRIC